MIIGQYLIGKGGHIRTVPVPDWVKDAIDRWLLAADIATGRAFRCVCRAGKWWGDGITEKVVWHVVKDHSRKLGLSNVAPHDLRRSCAKFCHAAGGELEQIQFLLGCVRSNHGEISWLQAAHSRSCERSAWYRAVIVWNASMTGHVSRLPHVVDKCYCAVRPGAACCFAGASAIKATPMTTRTATPTSSPRETIFRNACVPITAA
jgi:hypothetical protein